MSKIELSFSGWSTYHLCPYKWKLHYKDRIRNEGDSSPLLFGVAIDEALNFLLLELKAGRRASIESVIDVFKNNFEWDKCKNSSWLKTDLDIELFTEDQLDQLKTYDNDYKTWACMRIKGRMMIEAYFKQVLPRIKEVHDVQFNIPGRPGIADAILSIDNDDKLLVDHKTTSRAYERDSVTLSNQLALYAGSIGISQAAYITLIKIPRKNKVKTCKVCGKDGSSSTHKTCYGNVAGSRCHGDWNISISPEAVCQVIKGVIPEESQKMMNDSLDDTTKLIETGHFPKNMASCHKMFGSPCQYFNYCRNGSMKNLCKKEEK